MLHLRLMSFHGSDIIIQSPIQSFWVTVNCKVSGLVSDESGGDFLVKCLTCKSIEFDCAI